MAQIKRTGRAKGSVIELDEPLPYEDWRCVEVSLAADDTPRRGGSPQEVAAAARLAPHVSHEDVAALEAAIRESRQPTRFDSIFNEEDTS